MATKITIAHSPDSDDAFMFYGFASGAVDTEGLEIAQVLADIETLNRAAVTGTYEVTAASFHAFAHLSDKYALLPHGAQTCSLPTSPCRALTETCSSGGFGNAKENRANLGSLRSP